MPHESRTPPGRRAALASDQNKITDTDSLAESPAAAADWWAQHVLEGRTQQLAFHAEALSDNTSTHCRRCGTVAPTSVCADCDPIGQGVDGVCCICGSRPAMPDSALCVVCDEVDR